MHTQVTRWVGQEWVHFVLAGLSLILSWRQIRKHAKQQWAVEVISRYYIGYKVGVSRRGGARAWCVVLHVLELFGGRFVSSTDDNSEAQQPKSLCDSSVL